MAHTGPMLDLIFKDHYDKALKKTQTIRTKNADYQKMNS